MAINARVNLEWHGVKYPVLIDMAMIERIEETINLAELVRDCSTGKLVFSKASRFVATLLNEAGAEVTTDDVFSGMFDGEGAAPAAVMNMVSSILGAIFPAPKKKPTQSSKKRKAKK